MKKNPTPTRRKIADRTFREEALERTAVLETEKEVLRERIEGIQIALGSRIEDMKRQISDTLESNQKEVIAKIQTMRDDLASRIKRIEDADVLRDAQIAKLDRWYNRSAGAVTAVSAFLAAVGAIAYELLRMAH